MRMLLAALFLVACSTSLTYGQKTRLGSNSSKTNRADYTIQVRISPTHIRSNCIEPGSSVNCSIQLYADAVMNGKKLELSGPAVVLERQTVIIIPGDYSARLVKDIHNADSTAIYQQYDLVLPDGTVWHSATSGISE